MRTRRTWHAYLLILVFIASVFCPAVSPTVAVAQVTTEQLVPGTSKTGSIAAAAPGSCTISQTQYTIQYPGRGARLELEFRSEQFPLNLAVRRNLPVTKEGDKFVADIGPHVVSRISLPNKPPLDPATFFIAVINCGPQTINFTLTAHLVEQTNADTVDLSFPSIEISERLELGSIPIREPNNCMLAQTQYKISLSDSAFCDLGSGWVVSLLSDQPLNLYARLGQRVAFENGEVVADLASKPPNGNGVFSAFSTVSSSASVRTFFVAVENCNSNAANYSLTLRSIIPDIPPPSITGASIEGKNLRVTGPFLSRSSTVLFNGIPQTTKYGGQQQGRFFTEDILIVKKGRKKIKPGESVMISVDTNSGCTTRPFQFVRPND